MNEDILIENLEARVAELEAAIRKHRDMDGDDRCREDDIELYRVLGEPIPDAILPEECEFLESCKRYYRQRRTPGFMDGMTIAQLEAEIKLLKSPRNLYVTTDEISEVDDPEKTYREFWATVLADNPDGELAQAKFELHDYYRQMHEWSKALCELTDGQLSKSTYTASVMIAEVTAAFERAREQDKEDERLEGFANAE